MNLQKKRTLRFLLDLGFEDKSPLFLVGPLRIRADIQLRSMLNIGMLVYIQVYFRVLSLFTYDYMVFVYLNLGHCNNQNERAIH